jgi:O-antigen/teichoic acid export membrane protein
MKRPRLSRDILVYGVGEVAVKAFGLITLPIYTRIFSPDEYGTLSVVLTVAGFVLALVALGGDSAFIRYFLAAPSIGERRTITSTWIGFLGVWSAVATILLLPFSGAIARLASGSESVGGLIAIALLLTPVRLINLMCAQLLRNEFRATQYIVLNVMSLALMVAGSVAGAVVLDLGVEGILLGTLAGELLMLPVRIWTSRHMLRWSFSAATLGRLLRYGVPLVPTSLAYWVFTTSDRVLLSNLSTLEQVGLYSVAAAVVNLANIAILALGQGWNPHAIYAYEADKESAGRLFARMFTYILAGFGLLAVGLTVFADELIAIFAGSDYAGASAAVLPLAVGMLAYATTHVTAGGISLVGRTTYLALYSWMAAVINIVLNVLLIPPFGMVGAAWATAAAYVSLTTGYGITSYRLWAFDYDIRPAMTTLALTATALLGTAALPDAVAGQPALGLGVMALKFLYCLALLAAMFWLGGLDRAELHRMRAALAGLRRRRAGADVPDAGP